MLVIDVRNVHEALPVGLMVLDRHGVKRPSRNGEVLVCPEPVSTVYRRPWERVLFWEERDANPFLHLYESLWMLRGRDDVAGPARYAKQMLQYSDDGRTLHGAYGKRWRDWFTYEDNGNREMLDQVSKICSMLRKDQQDRRCVLQMWDANHDLGRAGKDVPCNLQITFQISTSSALDMTVFCRSNDIVWGCYGANAVHMSFLQEYVALMVGVPVGIYTQISVNWHAYLTPQLYDLQVKLVPHYLNNLDAQVPNPYDVGVRNIMMTDQKRADLLVGGLLLNADTGDRCAISEDPWFQVCDAVLSSHRVHKERGPAAALEHLASRAVGLENVDWVVAARQWLYARATRITR